MRRSNSFHDLNEGMWVPLYIVISVRINILSDIKLSLMKRKKNDKICIFKEEKRKKNKS